MPKFVGHIDRNKRVVIQGDTLKEAMALSGYIPRTQVRSIGRLVGVLSDGRRFSFRLAPLGSYKMDRA